jgi:hypothetical protein
MPLRNLSRVTLSDPSVSQTLPKLSLYNMASTLPVLLVLFVVAGLMAVSWFSVRKGPQQTCVHTYSMSAPQPLANYCPSAQAHPNQPNANFRVLLLDVGHSVPGPATSPRRYAHLVMFFERPS